MMHRRSFLTGIIAAPIVEKFGSGAKFGSSGKIYISTTSSAKASELANLEWVEIRNVIAFPDIGDTVHDYNPYPNPEQ